MRLTTEERWPHDAEDLSQCLFQQQTLQRKEEEEIPKCLTMYEKCLHGSIHLLHQSNHPSIHPSTHACMHACVHPVGKAQANRFTDVCAKGYLDFNVNCLNCPGLPQFFFVFQPGFVAFVAFVASGFCGFCGFCGCAAFVALPCLSYLSTYLSDLTCFNLT